MVERVEVLLDELLPEDVLVVVEVAHGALLEVAVHDPVRVDEVVPLDARLRLDTAAARGGAAVRPEVGLRSNRKWGLRSDWKWGCGQTGSGAAVRMGGARRSDRK